MTEASKRSSSGRGRGEGLETRVTADQKRLIKHADALPGRTLTDFVLTSVQDAARRAIEEYQHRSLSMRLPDLPDAVAGRMPRLPLILATLLDRLAVDPRHRGKGYSRFLPAGAFFRAGNSEIASFARIVEAKDETARRFYGRESLEPFPDHPLELFRAMADIKPLFR